MFGVLAVCAALLTREELGYVRATETHSTRGALAVSQCFYEMPSFANSVSLMVMSGKSARQYWERHMAGEHEQSAVEVRGIGREALWSGNKLAGALYVLGDGVILRVSPGGAGSVEQKIARAKSLARGALTRIR